MTAQAPIAATHAPAALSAMGLDVAIIGAGPAGAAAALAARRAGASVLLVDRAAFPRTKVCGCCLNHAALEALSQLDAAGALRRLGADALTQLDLAAGGRRARLALDSGIAISRGAMDAALIRLAIERGVAFVPRIRATVAGRAVRLKPLDAAGEPVTVEPGIIIAADGLGASAMGDAAPARRGSRMGVGAVLAADARFERGVVHMACAAGGYVGLVRLEDSSLNIAGAFDAATLRRAGGVAAAVRDVLIDAGMPIPADMDQGDWRGTPLLTRRRRRPWAPGVLFAGDAAGYVEPLTGEGMAWAIGSGLLAGQLAGAAGRWSPTLGRQWAKAYRGMIHRRQRVCRLLSGAVRRPRLTRLFVHAATRWPTLGRGLKGCLHRTPHRPAGPTWRPLP